MEDSLAKISASGTGFRESWCAVSSVLEVEHLRIDNIDTQGFQRLTTDLADRLLIARLEVNPETMS